MKTLILLSICICSVLSYLDVTLLQVDKRLENEQGYVNPFRLGKRLYQMVYLNLSRNASNDQAWTQLKTVLYSSYTVRSAQQMESIFQAMASIVDRYFMAYQESYVGSFIDLFGAVVTGRHNQSSATIRAHQLGQGIVRTFTEGVLTPISTLFYNPLDTEMISALNSSDVLSFKRSLFDLFDCPSYYVGASSYPDYSTYNYPYNMYNGSNNHYGTHG